MPIRPINTLKNWFITGAKPLQSQFWDWLDSFWHKDEPIPGASVTGFTQLQDDVVALQAQTGGPVVINSTASTVLYQINAGKLLEKVIIKSTATMTFQVGTAPGIGNIPVGQQLSANIPALLYIDQYADGTIKNIYFEGLSGSVTIILYIR
jgi:hypothetical protein